MMTRYSLSKMNYAKDKTIFYDKYNGLPRISDVRDGKRCQVEGEAEVHEAVATGTMIGVTQLVARRGRMMTITPSLSLGTILITW